MATTATAPIISSSRRRSADGSASRSSSSRRRRGEVPGRRPRCGAAAWSRRDHAPPDCVCARGPDSGWSSRRRDPGPRSCRRRTGENVTARRLVPIERRRYVVGIGGAVGPPAVGRVRISCRPDRRSGRDCIGAGVRSPVAPGHAGVRLRRSPPLAVSAGARRPSRSADRRTIVRGRRLRGGRLLLAPGAARSVRLGLVRHRRAFSCFFRRCRSVRRRGTARSPRDPTRPPTQHKHDDFTRHGRVRAGRSSTLGEHGNAMASSAVTAPGPRRHRSRRDRADRRGGCRASDRARPSPGSRWPPVPACSPRCAVGSW